MNFDEAVVAHAGWKMKLSAYLKKPDGSLKVAAVEPDNLCALGKWLHEAATVGKCGGIPEYKQLVAAHATFHKQAAAIIREADAGKSVAEQLVLGSDSPYAKASASVVGLIMVMKTKCP